MRLGRSQFYRAVMTIPSRTARGVALACVGVAFGGCGGRMTGATVAGFVDSVPIPNWATRSPTTSQDATFEGNAFASGFIAGDGHRDVCNAGISVIRSAGWTLLQTRAFGQAGPFRHVYSGSTWPQTGDLDILYAVHISDPAQALASNGLIAQLNCHQDRNKIDVSADGTN